MAAAQDAIDRLNDGKQNSAWFAEMGGAMAELENAQQALETAEKAANAGVEAAEAKLVAAQEKEEKMKKFSEPTAEDLQKWTNAVAAREEAQNVLDAEKEKVRVWEGESESGEEEETSGSDDEGGLYFDRVGVPLVEVEPGVDGGDIVRRLHWFHAGCPDGIPRGRAERGWRHHGTAVQYGGTVWRYSTAVQYVKIKQRNPEKLGFS